MSKQEDDQKKCKNNNLVLIESIKDDKNVELDEKETELKDKLAYIENKLKSIKKIIKSIEQEDDETLYKSDAFDVLIGSIAVTAAINTIAEYFDVNLNDIDNLIK